MGIRFRCHHCEYELNLKNFQAGRRGRCPECSGRFRVPTQSTDYSIPLETSEESVADVESESTVAAVPQTLTQARTAVAPIVHAPTQSRTAPQRSSDVSAGSVAKPDSVVLAPSAGGTATPPMPAVVAEALDAVWYIRPPSGGQFGPADGKVFFQWLLEGRVAVDAYVWRDGWSDWRIAREVLGEHFGPSTEGTTSDTKATTTATTKIVADEPVKAAASPAKTTASAKPQAEAVKLEEPLQVEPTQPELQVEPFSAGVAPDPTRSAAGPAKLITRRRKQRNQYAVGIVVLSVVAIILVVVLVLVLNR